MAAEKLWNAANSYSVTSFSSVRYGNVIGSRGSVIPLFQTIEGDTAPVTDPDMTRFWITLEQAVDLILMVYECKDVGAFVPKLKSMDMGSLARCFKDRIEVIGVRPGEKKHENLVAIDETVWLTDIGLAAYRLFNGQYDSYNCERFTQEEMLCLIES